MLILDVYKKFENLEKSQEHKVVLTNFELAVVKMALYNFTNLKTRGYERQFERLVKYIFEEARSYQYIYLYTDEIQIIEMCIYSISEV